MLRRLLFLLIALASLGSTRAQQVVITPLPSSSASLNVTLSNAGAVAIAEPEWIASPLYFVHTTATASPPCLLTQTAYNIRLATPALAAGASISCVLTFARDSAAPIPSTGLDFRARSGDPALVMMPSTWILGSVADLRLRVEPVLPLPPQGATEALFRVVVSNPSDALVSGVVLGRCADFGVSPFRVDSAIQGGCGDPDVGVLCFSAAEFEFAIPAVPARGESSCVLRASRLVGLVAGAGTNVFIESASARSDAGYWVSDPGLDNDDASFAIGFLAAASIPVLQPWSLLALLLGIALFAVRALARSRVGQ
ncbi:MAG: hypothetical protein IT478_14500 [Xanthomonadales bacterium]|nr:hypothetical protein [Xanthomonadales bacterium]MCC6562566.1 hypothetical protein [Xanthomonadales bacterium]